jgi:hypothetical protein
LAVMGTLAWAFIGCLFTLWRPAKEA